MVMDFLKKISRSKENAENRESKVKEALKNPSNFSPLIQKSQERESRE